ncbi:hypothetical protein EYR97_13355 [Alteromonas sp. KUL42]|nr:hypothetical protein EYR97_13355 [Alteromonas sp. KUL42]
MIDSNFNSSAQIWYVLSRQIVGVRLYEFRSCVKQLNSRVNSFYVACSLLRTWTNDVP